MTSQTAATIEPEKLPALLFQAAATFLVLKLGPSPLRSWFPTVGEPQPRLGEEAGARGGMLVEKLVAPIAVDPHRGQQHGDSRENSQQEHVEVLTRNGGAHHHHSDTGTAGGLQQIGRRLPDGERPDHGADGEAPRRAEPGGDHLRRDDLRLGLLHPGIERDTAPAGR